MGQVKKPYGTWSRAVLQELRNRGVLKVEALVRWLYEHNIEIDRTLVSHWIAGRSHLPADMLPHLAKFTMRPELVFGLYLREINCDLVHLPEAEIKSQEITDLMLSAGVALGHLQHSLLQAKSPDSPGGETITRAERAQLRRHIDELLQQLADMRETLDQS